MIQFRHIGTTFAMIICVGFFFSVNAEAATYYISPAGSDTRSCADAQTISTPKQTIASGVPCANAGDTVYLRAGTYLEVLQESNFTSTGTSWANAITVAAYPAEIATLQPVFTSAVGIFSTGLIHHIIIDRLIMDGVNAGGGAGTQVVYFGDDPGGTGQGVSHHIRLTNVEIKNGDYAGIIAYGDSLEFLNCNVHSNGRFNKGGSPGGNGFYMSGMTNSLIDGGSSWDNAAFGVRTWSSNADLSGNNNIVRNMRIYQNGYMIGIGGTSTTTSDSGGVSVGDDNNTYYNNLIYGNYAGIQVWGGIKPATNAKIYNNTVYNNGPSYGILVQAGTYGTRATNTIVLNNISFRNAGGNYIDNGGTTTADHNLTGATDPLFVNVGATLPDFHLSAGSNARDAGVTIALVPVDFAGTARPQGPAYDIGAYEFSVQLSTPLGLGLILQ